MKRLGEECGVSCTGRGRKNVKRWEVKKVYQ